ncbi:hypothetical protein C370_07256, partial [Cryptococcus neoformans A1-35-8]
KQVNFKNTIICLTSNLGSEALYEPDACHPDGSITEATRTNVLDHVGRFFRPELINRLDELLIFNKLPPSIIINIVDLRLREVQKRLEDRRITLDVGDDVKAWLARKGYSEHFGARAVARIVRDVVTNKVASKLLDGSIGDGEIIKLALEGDEAKTLEILEDGVEEDGDEGKPRRTVYG